MGKTFTRPDGSRGGTWTSWKGRWFRSALESSWAECWDAWGVVYEYEPTRVQLGECSYLVDFRLPVLGCYVEVKPAPATVHEAWLCKRLAQTTAQPVYLVVGHPWSAELAVYHGDRWRPAERRELFGVEGDGNGAAH